MRVVKLEPSEDAKLAAQHLQQRISSKCALSVGCHCAHL